MTHVPQDLPRVALSRRKTAATLDCSIDHVDDLVNQGLLEKVQIGPRRVAINWRSILKLVGEAA